MPTFPPTIIVVHPKEKRRKCTVEPLRGRDGFVFWKFPQTGNEPLDGYVRLGLGGSELSEADAERGLLVLDATWRLAENMESSFSAVPIRSLPPWQTAYPRNSKLFQDPEVGLASIEAIFVAYHILGRDTNGLLDDYFWSAPFQELNQSKIGLDPKAPPMS